MHDPSHESTLQNKERNVMAEALIHVSNLNYTSIEPRSQSTASASVRKKKSQCLKQQLINFQNESHEWIADKSGDSVALYCLNSDRWQVGRVLNLSTPTLYRDCKECMICGLSE